MSLTDPISDLLTRIRNAQLAMHETVSIPHSKLKEEVVRILKEEGYITDYGQEMKGEFKHIKVTLKYVGDRNPAIQTLQRVSKPGRRVYVSRDEIRPVLGGLGISVLSTSRGIMTGRAAHRQGVGGELLLQVC